MQVESDVFYYRLYLKGDVSVLCLGAVILPGTYV